MYHPAEKQKHDGWKKIEPEIKNFLFDNKRDLILSLNKENIDEKIILINNIKEERENLLNILPIYNNGLLSEIDIYFNETENKKKFKVLVKNQEENDNNYSDDMIIFKKSGRNN
ncbi:hypothetical protein ACTA71_011305 [Dictyostelium dimigraforme]